MAALLELHDVYKLFPIVIGGVIKRKMTMLKAVDGISFSIEKGACFGIAGESGSGKTYNFQNDTNAGKGYQGHNFV